MAASLEEEPKYKDMPSTAPSTQDLNEQQLDLHHQDDQAEEQE